MNGLETLSIFGCGIIDRLKMSLKRQDLTILGEPNLAILPIQRFKMLKIKTDGIIVWASNAKSNRLN